MGLSSAGVANLLAAHRWFHDAYSVGDVESACQVLAPKVLSVGMGAPVEGVAAHAELARGLRRTWPGCHIRFEDVVESDDRLAIFCRVRARHHTAARSEQLSEFVGYVVMRFEAGRIVHTWNCWDFLTGLTSAGQLPEDALGRCLAPSGRAPAPAPTRRGRPAKRSGAGRAELLRRWFESAYDERNLQAIDECFTPDVFAHGLGTSIRGQQEFAERFYLPFLSTFPECRFRVRDVVGDGDVAAVCVDVEATHVGGKRVAFSGGGFVHFRGDRIAGAHNCWDFLSMLEQTGVLEPGRLVATSA